MKRVIIESPYAGEVARNEEYARRALADSLSRGEAPFASHLLYTQPGVLDDTDQSQRDHGIAAGLSWAEEATLTAVYQDYGISSGMNQGIMHANLSGRQVVYRRIGRNI